MLSLGFLTLHPQQDIEFSTSLAKRAHQQGIDVYRFTPTSINPVDEQVMGVCYDAKQDKWVETTFSIPSFIYDRCYYRRDTLSKKARPIVQWLKSKKDVTFLGYGLPSKWEVYTKLKQHPDLAPYLPFTTQVQSAVEIIDLLNEHSRLLVKPINGSQGRNIFVVLKDRKGVQVKFHSTTGIEIIRFQQIEDFTTWASRKLLKHQYVAQPYLQIGRFQNAPFDIRILFQKDENGQWKEMGRGIRKGKEDSIVTNISHGAEVSSFSTWLNRLHPVQRDFVSAEINSICAQLPEALEQSFPRLCELGIDLCVCNDFSVWILDLNSKPGRKTIIQMNPENETVLYDHLLSYCRHLDTLQSLSRKE
ncbi:YheC/YheD family protein [Bacillus sp. CGMCC 1.16541]|uniref:YheC/YheD family endospore coat-associated protein n=1 Tax=Bacillus sp. CGMCC 1.16541 TaxID=2185143 RepID=UPI000D73960B|nr:YheC/YheD family protein [Bacillus sp. CGMCC 1.16541]